MIKEREIRIGDFLHKNGVLHRTTAHILFEMWQAKSRANPQLTEYEPIPLTKEWLIKFGFEEKPTYMWHGNGADYQPPDNYTICQDFTLPVHASRDVIIRFQTWFYTADWKEKRELMVRMFFTEWYERVEENEWVGIIPDTVHRLQSVFYWMTELELLVKL